MRSVDIGFEIEKVGAAKEAQEWMRTAGYAEVFSQLLNQGISGQFPNGIPLGKGKILAGIQVKLREIEPTETELEVEEAEYDILKSVFLNENTLFNWAQLQLAVRYAEAIERSEKRKSPAELKVAD